MWAIIPIVFFVAIMFMVFLVFDGLLPTIWNALKDTKKRLLLLKLFIAFDVALFIFIAVKGLF